MSDALPLLETPRLRLRPLTPGDLDAFEEIFTDRETLLYWSGDPVPDRAAAKGILDRELEWVAKGQALTWAPALRTTGEAIGKVTLFHHDKVNRRAELGYIIARRHWRQGYMTEALGAVVEHAYGAMDLHRLEADVDPDNAASLALLERLGFAREGRCRQRWFVLGEWRDSLLFGRLRDGA